MEDRETARMRKYGESKTTRIMMATVPHVISGLGLRKFQADGFWLTRVYVLECENGLQVLDIFSLRTKSSEHEQNCCYDYFGRSAFGKWYGKSYVYFQALLTAALDGCEQSTSSPGRLNPRRKRSGMH